MSPDAMPARALYIHTPYCVSKCPYCDFYKVARPDPTTIAAMTAGRAYLRALEAEAQQRRDECPCPHTVFIGGGTPSALSVDELGALFELLHRVFDLSQVAEWTVENNPNSLTLEKARLMRDAGVNRMSIGVQSFNNRALQFLGRAHRCEHVVEAFAACRSAGIHNLNLDLIAALGPASGLDEPARTLADIDHALTAPDIGPLTHVSVYTLIIEEGTPFYVRQQTGERLAPTPDVEATCYEALVARCEAHGLGRYEISNFARPSFECRHNLAYWRCEPYLGLGPSAHSFDGQRRRGNVRDLAQYVRALDPCSGSTRDFAAIAFDDVLTPTQLIEERLLMGLRTVEGVDGRRLERDAPGTTERLAIAAAPLVEQGLMVWHADYLRLTPRGLPVCDRVVLELAARLDVTVA